MGLAKKSVGTFISQVLTLFIQFFIGVMTARFLGPEGKGLIYVLIVAIGVSVALGNLGLGQAAIYFVGKNRNYLPTTFGNLLVMTGVASLILVIGGWLFLRYGQPTVYMQYPMWMWGIAACLVPMSLLNSLLMQVLSAILRIKEINLIDIARATIHLLFFVLLVVIVEKGIQGAFLAYAFSWILATSSFFVLVLYYGGRPSRPDWMLLVASLRYGVKAYLSNLLERLALRFDALLVASLAVNGVQATGVYSVATSLAELLLLIPVSIRLSLFPMVSAGSIAEANRLTSAACRHSILWTIILALGLGTIGWYTIQPIYGEEFGDAVTPLLLLLPGGILSSQVIILYGDLNGRGKPGAPAIGALISLIMTVVLGVILIPQYGITGAAIASLCTNIVKFSVAICFSKYYTELRWKYIFLLQESDLYYYISFLRNNLSLKIYRKAKRLVNWD